MWFSITSKNICASGETAKNNKNMTLKIVIGKPNENRFSCGADRVIMPTARLIKNNTPTIGNIMSAAFVKSFSDVKKPTLYKRSKSISAPIGTKA